MFYVSPNGRILTGKIGCRWIGYGDGTRCSSGKRFEKRFDRVL